jgi:hypothetical protein
MTCFSGAHAVHALQSAVSSGFVPEISFAAQSFWPASFLASKDFAFSSFARRFALSPRPARFMKYVSIRIPEPSPFGETFLEASVLAIVPGFPVNNPAGRRVESVFTVATHFFRAVVISTSSLAL